jgi:hypothetical protein
MIKKCLPRNSVLPDPVSCSSVIPAVLPKIAKVRYAGAPTAVIGGNVTDGQGMLQGRANRRLLLVLRFSVPLFLSYEFLFLLPRGRTRPRAPPISGNILDRRRKISSERDRGTQALFAAFLAGNDCIAWRRGIIAMHELRRAEIEPLPSQPLQPTNSTQQYLQSRTHALQRLSRLWSFRHTSGTRQPLPRSSMRTTLPYHKQYHAGRFNQKGPSAS